MDRTNQTNGTSARHELCMRSNPVAGRKRPPEPGWVDIEDEGVVARCGWGSRKTTMKVKLEALRKLVFQIL